METQPFICPKCRAEFEYSSTYETLAVSLNRLRSISQPKKKKKEEGKIEVTAYLTCPNGHTEPYTVKMKESEMGGKLEPGDNKLESIDAPPLEIVDDKYWLKYAKNAIGSSITSLNDGAEKLKTIVLWFWGLYTASFTIGVSNNLIEASTLTLILLALPIVLLILSYWCCIRAQLPVDGHLNPRIPFSIKKAYNSGWKEKDRWFKTAIILTLISAFSLIATLTFVHKRDGYSLSASFNEKKDMIIISGILPKNTTVTTTIDSVSNSKSKETFYVNYFMVQDNGVLNLNVPADSTMRDLVVSTVWKEDNVEKGFVQSLKK